MSKSEQFKRTQAIWKSSLNSALRTALACIIVGLVTLYGPESVNKQVAFPAFSYVVVILIITNGTLGDTIRGCWLALCATIQTVCPALLCLYIVGPTRLTATSTSLILAIAAFFVALPEWTHLVAKRIALGQLVIIYVVGYINAEHTEAIMHPVHVAASTALGALACLVAMLLPYPHLASSEVKQNSTLFAENASERLKIFVKAFLAEDSVSSQTLISQAKCLAAKARKLLQCIKSKQESMHWEKFPIQLLRPYCKNPGDRLQELETPLRGMEIALSNSTLPVILDERQKEGMSRIEGQISQNLEQLKSHMPCETSTVPDSNAGHVMEFLQTLQTVPSSEKDLPSYFFLFCMKLLHTQARAMTVPSGTPKAHKNTLEKQNQPNEVQEQQNGLSLEGIWASLPFTVRKRLVPALKCSLSLGFAVLFGLYYSKPNGFWAGLPVGISLAAAREATFKVANIKFQGTVIGNVYGVIGCFIFERFVQIRFVALLPWFLFTSFLQRSKMYGQAGAVSAVIGAVLILGRRNFGPPSEFAVERIVETFIGLSCSIMVELLLQPTRATSLAKVQLSKTLGMLQESIYSIDLATSKAELQERSKGLKTEVAELDKYVGEAEAEPNFWFLPFHAAVYKKLLGSLAKMADLLLFKAHAIGFVEEQIQRLEAMGCKDALSKLNGDLKLVEKMTSSSIKSLQEVISIKSLLVLEKDLAKSGSTFDIELGKSRNNPGLNEDLGKITSSYLDHLKEVSDKIQFSEDEEDIKSRIVLSFSVLGYCLSSLMKETIELEKTVKELVQWENPTSQINLHEISCKVHALYN